MFKSRAILKISLLFISIHPFSIKRNLLLFTEFFDKINLIMSKSRAILKISLSFISIHPFSIKWNLLFFTELFDKICLKMSKSRAIAEISLLFIFIHPFSIKWNLLFFAELFDNICLIMSKSRAISENQQYFIFQTSFLLSCGWTPLLLIFCHQFVISTVICRATTHFLTRTQIKLGLPMSVKWPNSFAYFKFSCPQKMCGQIFMDLSDNFHHLVYQRMWGG